MDKIKIIFAFFAALSAGAAAAQTQDLQSLIDTAASDGASKIVNVSGTHFIKKPIRLSPKHSGIKIIGDKTAVVNGGKKIESWQSDGKILKAKIDADEIEMLYVNGERATCAQSNNFLYMHSAYTGTTNPDGSPRKTPEKNVFIARNVDLATLEGLTQQELSNVYIDIYRNWYNFKCKIEAIVKNPDNETSTVFLYEKMGRPFIRKGVKTPPRFKICNLQKEFDAQGEFYFDKKTKTLSYFPRNGETLENITAYYPVTSCAVEIYGENSKNPVSNILIEGIVFECGGHFPSSDWRPSVQAASSTDGFISSRFAKNLKIENCTIRNVNTYGICMKAGTQNSKIENCTLLDCGSGGIAITSVKEMDTALGASRGEENQSKFIEVRNNIIGGYGRWQKGGIGVAVFDCGEITIDHNTIFDGYYTGISSGWAWSFDPNTHVRNNKYTNNKIFNIGYNTLCDMGGIYTLGISTGSVISGNEIYNIQRHQYGGWGIYNDQASSGFIIEKNYVHDTQEDGYFLHYGKHLVIRNNIFSTAEVSEIGLGAAAMRAKPDDKRVYDIKFEKNIVILSPSAKMFRGGNNPKPAEVVNKVFENNIYWKLGGGEVKFDKRNFDAWKADYKQDENSIVADPQWNAKTLKFENSIYKKIGFKPFDISKAGVVGKMKNKFDTLMKTYKFPADSKISAIPPWRSDKGKDALPMQ